MSLDTSVELVTVVTQTWAWPASSMKTWVKCSGGNCALASLPAVTRVVTSTLNFCSVSMLGYVYLVR